MRNLAVLAVLMPTVAFSQSATVGNDNNSTSAVIIEGAGSPSDTQTLKTNPDVGIPPLMTAPMSCVVGDKSAGVGSFLFGGAGASWTKLDEGCERRADSAHLANLAVTRADLFSDYERAEKLLTLAEVRMTMDSEQWQKTWPAWSDEPWEEFWRP